MATTLALASPVLDPTMETVACRWPVLADDPARPIGRVEVAACRLSDGRWSEALPGSLFDGRARGLGYELRGVVDGLAAGQAHRVRLRLWDTSGQPLLEATAEATTRAETIPDAGCLAPTRYVDAAGDDAGDGSWLAPWRTLAHAQDAAPAGAVIEIGPGHFRAPGLGGAGRNVPLTWTARYPAVSSFDAATFAVKLAPRRLRTHVYAWMTAPASSPLADDRAIAGGWTPTTVGGVALWCRTMPVANLQHLAYRAVSPGADYADEKAGPLTVLPHWLSEPTFPSVEAWAAVLGANASCRYGWWQSQYAGGVVLYARFPEGIDPNETYACYGAASWTAPWADLGFRLLAPDSRVSGVVLRGLANGVRIETGAHRAVVDRIVSDGTFVAAVVNGSNTNPSAAEDVTVQDFVVRYTSVSATEADAADPTIVPWWAVKSGVIDPATGANYPGISKPITHENAGVTFRYGTRRAVVRRGRIEGTFNGVNSFAVRPTDADGYVLADLYGRRIADNAWEPEGEVRCLAILRCRADECNTAYAAAIKGGPILVRDAVAWRCSNRHLAPKSSLTPTDTGTAGAASWKFGSSIPGAVIQRDGTCWSDADRRDGQPTDGYEAASGSGLSTTWDDARMVERVPGTVAKAAWPRTLAECVEAGGSDPARQAALDAGLADPPGGDLTPVPGGMLDGKGARCHRAAPPGWRP